jgi:carbonic anhydrase
MRKTISIIALSTILATFGYADKPTEVKEGLKKHEEAKEHHKKHWGYSGDVAASQWWRLDEKFKMCDEGRQQSPINVVPNKDVNLSDLDLNYTKGSTEIVNNGHAVQVNIEGGDIFTIDGVPYELKQFHFHTPSENHIMGKSFPMEAHFVHATKDGKLAVIAVLFEEGAENKAMGEVIKSFPIGEGKKGELKISSDSVKAVMPKNMEYYKFMGSLTTPPCSEQVKWFVLKNPQTVSKAQIKAMEKEIAKENNRPIQPKNGRVIEE